MREAHEALARARLLNHSERRVELCVRVSADPHVEGRGLKHPSSRGGAPVGQLRPAQSEAHRPLLARRERDALDTLQLAHGPRGAPPTLVYVELRDLFARASARVLQVKGDFNRSEERRVGKESK